MTETSPLRKLGRTIGRVFSSPEEEAETETRKPPTKEMTPPPAEFTFEPDIGWGWVCLDCTSKSLGEPRTKGRAARLATMHASPSNNAADHRVVLVPIRYLEDAYENGDNGLVLREAEAETLSQSDELPSYMPKMTERQLAIVESMLSLAEPGETVQTADIAQEAENLGLMEHDRARSVVSKLAGEGRTQSLIVDAGYGQWRLATEEEYRQREAARLEA